MTQRLYQQPPTNGAAPLTQEAFEVRPSAGVPPRPLREALGQLPRQYMRVLREASPRTFTEEMGQAGWPLVWVQLLGLTGINIALIWVFNRFPSLHALGLMTHGGRGPQWLVHLATLLSHPLGQLLLTPLNFFLFSGLLYLLARAVRGQGSFLAQNYTTLLFSVPLTLINYIPGLVLGLIPFVGAFLFGLLTFVVGICGLVWQIYVVMAVHRLSGGKAAGVVVLTVLVGILLTLVPGGSLLIGF